MTNPVGRPKKYVQWKDWEAWLLKEWYPFKRNELAHLERSIDGLEKDMTWVKWLLGGLVLAIISTAIAVICGML